MSNSAIRLSLSAKGLQRVGSVNQEGNCSFVVGGERYSCLSFVAEFLSPRVSSLRFQDITIDELSIETADPSHQFGSLLLIGFGREVSFAESDMKFVRSVCVELQNYELFEKTLEFREGELKEDALKDRRIFGIAVRGGWKL
jgi:hypothetical protein